jgi:hypothetical protein
MPSTGRDWKMSRNVFGKSIGASRGIIEAEDLPNTRGGLLISSFASLIPDETVDRAELVEFVLDIFRGRRGAGVRMRLDAATWLADRAYRRSPAEKELSDLGSIGGIVSVDLQRLGTPELELLGEIVETASDNAR